MDEQTGPTEDQNNQPDPSNSPENNSQPDTQNTPETPDQSATPAEASSETSNEPVTVTTDDQPATPTQSTVGGPSGPPVTSDATSGPRRSKKGLLFGLVLLLVVAGLAAVGYIVTRPEKPVQKVVVVTKKDIPVLQVAAFSPLPHNYYPNVQNDQTQSDINMQLFEGLTKFENGTTLTPNLADSWTNPDTSTWVFKLHPGVKFHTGKTMTASDVKASIEAIQPTDFGQIYAATIKSVDVVDPLTVKITTDGPDPLLANELTQLFIYDTTSGKTNDAINGTGPYTLKSDTADSVDLAAFDGYHGGHVYSREVDYVGYQTSADVPTDSLTNKTLQILTVQNEPAFTAKLKGYGYTLANVPSYAVGHLVFNTSKAGTPFANVKVRQAIAQAIDKQTVITASSNTGSPVANQTIAEGIPGYNPAIKGTTFSTTAAKAALAAAGYPNGFSFKLTYYPPTQALAEEVQKEMAVIGVKVTLDPESDQHQLIKIALGGGTDMYYDLVSSSYVDGSDVLSDFIDSPNYTNPDLTKLNTAASHELNPTKRVAILQQMGALIESDQADVPLFQRQAFVLASAPNIVVSTDVTGTAIGTYFWQTYAK